MASLINGTTTTKAEIEAVQTVPPSRITSARTLRRVSGGDSGVVPAGGCVHVVLYYNKASEGEGEGEGVAADSGSIHAGWIKESLAEALSGQPLLAGRLQRSPNDGDQSGLAVVSNDAGVRLVEARVNGVTVGEFVESGGAEAELVFWNGKDIEGTDPQFSPLFYVQVTKFDCGGYSFGISCSILLADLLLNENFLKKWAEIHNNLLNKNGMPEKPLFYLPNLKNIALAPKIGNIFSSNPSKDSGQTIIFNVAPADHQTNTHSTGEFSALAMLCVAEAESKLGAKMAPILTSLNFTSGQSDLVKIENISRHELVVKPNVSLTSRISRASWDDFGANELEFRKGNRPLRVSHWIGSVSSELVMGIPFSHGQEGVFGLKMIVSFPHN